MNKLSDIFNNIESMKIEDSDGSEEVTMELPLVHLGAKSFNVCCQYSRQIVRYLDKLGMWGVSSAVKLPNNRNLSYYNGGSLELDLINNLVVIKRDLDEYKEILTDKDATLLTEAVDRVIAQNSK